MVLQQIVTWNHRYQTIIANCRWMREYRRDRSKRTSADWQKPVYCKGKSTAMAVPPPPCMIQTLARFITLHTLHSLTFIIMHEKKEQKGS